MQKHQSLYEKDFYAWCIQQSDFLSKKRFTDLDLANLKEEIECMGKREKRELDNRLTILFLHILKCIYQPEKRTRSWETSIRIQRLEALKHLKENPSLQPYISESIEFSYEKAVSLASEETGLIPETFPEKMPFKIEQALDKNWMP